MLVEISARVVIDGERKFWRCSFTFLPIVARVQKDWYVENYIYENCETYWTYDESCPYVKIMKYYIHCSEANLC